MTQQQENQIDAAFEILLEEIEGEINVHQKEDLMVAHDARDFVTARKLIDLTEALINLRQAIDGLRRDLPGDFRTA